MSQKNSKPKKNDPQLLHIVLGGELEDVRKTRFKDLSGIDFVGAFPDYTTAFTAWKAAAQGSVDNAHMRYFIIHAHRLFDPENDHHDHD
ncbi:MAG: inositol monophosphatase [Robiginitomaculum sp.]|nr:MAG: inositol monophosphatase [Robiginitomaculum sp.]